MELYNVPKDTRVRFTNGYEVMFHHIDGMYSYCTTDEGNVVHPSAWSEVEIVTDNKQQSAT